MAEKKVIGNERDYIYPVFKFQKEEHARKMWDRGNIYISKIKDFRHNYGSKIQDEREGQVSLYLPHDANTDFSFIFVEEKVSIDDALIYCTTNNFFSGTLRWALSEQEKNHCVLVTDIDEVTKRISEKLSFYDYIGTGLCQYVGRDIYLLPQTTNELGVAIKQNPINAAWVKPVDYKDQCEVRSLWYPKGKATILEFFNENIDIHDFVIPIEHVGMKNLINHSGYHTIKTEVVTIDGEPNAWFQLKYPYETFTPVIHRFNEDYLLGFLSYTNNIIDGTFHGGQVGLEFTSIGPIGGNVFLKDVVKIVYTVLA